MRAVVNADLVCQLDEILQLLPQLCALAGKQPVRHRLRRGFVRAVGNVQTPAQERRVVGGKCQRVGAGGRDGDKLIFRVLGKLDVELFRFTRSIAGGFLFYEQFSGVSCRKPREKYHLLPLS